MVYSITILLIKEGICAIMYVRGSSTVQYTIWSPSPRKTPPRQNSEGERGGPEWTRAGAPIGLGLPPARKNQQERCAQENERVRGRQSYSSKVQHLRIFLCGSRAASSRKRLGGSVWMGTRKVTRVWLVVAQSSQRPSQYTKDYCRHPTDSSCTTISGNYCVQISFYIPRLFFQQFSV